MSLARWPVKERPGIKNLASPVIPAPVVAVTLAAVVTLVEALVVTLVEAATLVEVVTSVVAMAAASKPSHCGPIS